MKRILVLMMAIVPLFVNCTKEINAQSDMQLREIAWNYLSNQEKGTVTIEWKLAIVRESVFNNKSVYAVVFNTADDMLLGPITVYIDITTKVVLGQASRM